MTVGSIGAWLDLSYRLCQIIIPSIRPRPAPLMSMATNCSSGMRTRTSLRAIMPRRMTTSVRSYSIVIRRWRWNDSNFWFRFAVPRKERGSRELSDCGNGRSRAVCFNFSCDFGKKLLRFLYPRRNCGLRLESSSASKKYISVYCHPDLK